MTDKKMQPQVKSQQLIEWELANGIDGTIQYILKGEVIGTAKLPRHTTNDIRLEIAYSLGIKDFDNFLFIRADGTIRNDASKTMVDNFHISAVLHEDRLVSIAQKESELYQKYLKDKNK